MKKVIKRSLKLTLEFSNTEKKDALENLWNEYNNAVNLFLSMFCEGKEVNEEFLKDYKSPLSYRFKQCAKRQAFNIYKIWNKNKRKKEKPKLRSVSMILDQRFFVLEKSKNSFEFWIKFSNLDRGNPIYLPVQSYSYLNQYFKDWNLKNGGRILKRNGKWLCELTFEKEIEIKEDGKKKGIDLGYRKLAVSSDGEAVGENLRKLIEKASSKKQGSKNQKKVRAQIKNYVNRCLKMIITCSVIIERLKYLKQRKKGIWSKNINRKFNFWIYGYVIKRIMELCEVVGVQCLIVSPSYTSQRCPNCGYVDSLNRDKEQFFCQKCNFSHDADYVGAINIFSRFTGEPIVPLVEKTQLKYLSTN